MKKSMKSIIWSAFITIIMCFSIAGCADTTVQNDIVTSTTETEIQEIKKPIIDNPIIEKPKEESGKSSKNFSVAYGDTVQAACKKISHYGNMDITEDLGLITWVADIHAWEFQTSDHLYRDADAVQANVDYLIGKKINDTVSYAFENGAARTTYEYTIKQIEKGNDTNDVVNREIAEYGDMLVLLVPYNDGVTEEWNTETCEEMLVKAAPSSSGYSIWNLYNGVALDEETNIQKTMGKKANDTIIIETYDGEEHSTAECMIAKIIKVGQSTDKPVSDKPLIYKYVKEDNWACADMIQFFCTRGKICDAWSDIGEFTFEVKNTAVDIGYIKFNDYESKTQSSALDFLGKYVDEYCLFEFYTNKDSQPKEYERYMCKVLEINKCTEYGNVKDVVEYGDTIRVLCQKANNPYSDSCPQEIVGNFVLNMEDLSTHFYHSTYALDSNTIHDLIRQLECEPYLSFGLHRNFMTYDTEYYYYLTAVGRNIFEYPEYHLPEDWNYQFDTPEIGSFKAYDSEGTHVEDMANGKLYGFDEWFAACSSWCACAYFKSVPKASSTLQTLGSISYGAENLSSDSRENVWAEGIPGDGIGETIEICQVYMGSNDDDLCFTQLCIVNGYAKDEKKWTENNRVKSLKLYFEDEYMGLITLHDTIHPQYIDISPVKMTAGDGCLAKFRFEIAEVYKGTLYDDTCLTGIVIEFDGRGEH